MALKNLTLNEMVQISDTMTNPESSVRARLHANPFLAPLVSLLTEAHLNALKVTPAATDPRLKALSAQAAALDVVHDALVSSTYELLTATATLADDGARYLELRDQLLPDGVSGATQITYEGQAGYVKRLRATLTDEQRRALATIEVAGRNLEDVVNEWLDAGERIGELDQHRQQLASVAGSPTTGSVLEARHGWIRAIKAIQAVALAAKLTDEDRAALFGALDEIEAAADQRSARRRASRVEQDVAADIDSARAEATLPTA